MTTPPETAGPAGIPSGAHLQAIGLNVRFSGVHAVADVDLEVFQGEIVGLIGPNGAGKTTLVNALSGFQRPSSGEVRLNGRQITGWSADRRARAGVARTFQSVRPFRGLTVRENVTAAAFASGARRRDASELADDVLELVGMSGRGSAFAGSLAYGEERRLGIARVLAVRPQILLLDEPAAGLNEQESDELLDVFIAVREKYGCGLLVIEHDMRLIMRLCDRLHVLNYGQTLSQGTPREVAQDPRVLEAYLGHRRDDVAS
jgi:branched-chain amino acid transport system ATP-binding protein